MPLIRGFRTLECQSLLEREEENARWAYDILEGVPDGEREGGAPAGWLRMGRLVEPETRYRVPDAE